MSGAIVPPQPDRRGGRRPRSCETWISGLGIGGAHDPPQVRQRSVSASLIPLHPTPATPSSASAPSDRLPEAPYPHQRHSLGCGRRCRCGRAARPPHRCPPMGRPHKQAHGTSCTTASCPGCPAERSQPLYSENIVAAAGMIVHPARVRERLALLALSPVVLTRLAGGGVRVPGSLNEEVAEISALLTSHYQRLSSDRAGSSQTLENRPFSMILGHDPSLATCSNCNIRCRACNSLKGFRYGSA